jgi:hypothetical protein
LPGLEIHTLPRDNAQELSDLLISRAGQAATSTQVDLAYEAPETSGAFSFDDPEFLDFEPHESPAMSVLGDYMPALERASEDLELLQESDLIGDLMHRARLSKLTGCIMPDLSPNHKGYTKTGIKAVKELGLGTTNRETHRVVHFARLAEKTGRLPTIEEMKKEVDHTCRNPRCVYHTQLLDGDENNRNMADAREIEPEIIAGKIFYISDRLDKWPWLKFAIAAEEEIPSKVISSRLGPYALWLASDKELVVYGQRLKCEVYDSLKPLGKKPINRKSRAKVRIPKPIEGNQVLFTKTKYRKRHIPDVKEMYRANNSLI